MASNIANVVFPGRFGPKTDNWSEYKERLLCTLAEFWALTLKKRFHYFYLNVANRLTHLLPGHATIGPVRPRNASYKDILSVLDKFYEPEVHETRKFHKRIRTIDKSICIIRPSVHSQI